jgi:protein ImuA
MGLIVMLSRLVSIPFTDLGCAIWRADALSGAAASTVVGTGHAALDAQLPGGGWPVGGLCEILQDHSGQQEWRLLLPALRLAGPGPVVLVGAPHVPFGPGLSSLGLDARRLLWVNAATAAARLWAAEQALRCTEVAAVLLWLAQGHAQESTALSRGAQAPLRTTKAGAAQLRRLQIAALAHAKLLFVMRPVQALAESSPAVLRLRLETQAERDELVLHILKRRGPPLAQPLLLPARAARLAALLACAGPPVPACSSSLPGSGHVLDCIAARP